MCRGDTPGLYIAAGVCASAQVEILDCLLKFKLNMNCNIAQLLHSKEPAEMVWVCDQINTADHTRLNL